MPELPEVETVRRSLAEKLVGKKILGVDIYHDNIIEYPNVLEFKKNIISQKINDVKRYGKWLIFELDDYYLLSHLRMEGKYFFKSSNDIRNKHEHVIFKLDDDIEFRYMDVRKFGKMHLILKDEIDKVGPLIKMGYEPWDKRVNVEYLKEKYKNKKLPIKSILLDQAIVVGIGNIYANEILFLSGINPLKKGYELSDSELELIIDNTKVVLEKAIAMGGSSIRSYTSVDGVSGLFQQELFVHGKVGDKCKKCGTLIEKIVVGGRGTYFCNKCQK